MLLGAIQRKLMLNPSFPLACPLEHLLVLEFQLFCEPL